MQPAENKDYSRDVILRLSPTRNTIIVEEQKPGGIATYREIDPLELYYVINQSYASNDYLDSGFLPEHCLHLSMSATEKYFVLWNPELRADVIYGDREYPNFPIPRMVFGVRVLENGKVAECSMGVVADEAPTVDAPMFFYPFSNVHSDDRVCTGNNVLPRYRKISALKNFPRYLLGLPDNDDMYDREHNRLKLSHGELLEHLKDKDPAYYYPNAGTPKVFICAMHPTNPECADLLSKKDSDLKKIIETRDIPCEDKTRNAAMRTAIWSYYGDDLQVNSVELDVTKGDAKPIWEKLQKYLPVYSLFQADRKNSDSDSEVQDPLHAAVKEILQDEGISQTLDHVAEIVEGKLQEVATRTLEKLREMSPDIANTLSPVIPPASSLKWADVFKSVTISGDESIPINKRGSGSKRLILLNFFRAEVERRKDEANAPGIIYAIEEPETSQHSENQKKLINALIALSTESNVQVIVTTHSAVLVNALDFKNIRLICADGSQKRVEAVRSGQLPFPSLNEVNYLAFSEISEGYHDELYGYLEEQGWLNEYKQGKTTVPYKKISANGTTREQQICMTEYIRHQIHHPENTYNARFNDSQLRRSIEDMRAFVTSKAQTPETT